MKIAKFSKYILRKLLPGKYHSMLRNYLLKIIYSSATYRESGFITEFNCDFMKDERFKQAYSLGKLTGSWGDGDNHWRTFVVCWAAQQCINKEGDFVECGVNRGGFAISVLSYTKLHDTKKKFYLLDTFEGLVDSQITDQERKNGVHSKGFVNCWDDVCTTFSKFDKTVQLIKGIIPETLGEVKSEKISFLSIDLNCAYPEIAAAEFFWDKLVSGGIIVLDDYGWPTRSVQKLAFDNFSRKRGVEVLALPTGQGLIIKP